MAYGQRVAFHINPLNYNIIVKNATCEWGRFYAWPDQDNDADPNNQQMAGGTTGVVAATGREDASSGTQGSFDIYDANSNAHIGTFSWNCPWSGSNSSSFQPVLPSDYVTQVTEGSVSGPLGDIYVKSCKFP